MERLKATAAEAERRRCRAEAEARWARGQAAGLASRLRSAESMLEQKTAQWEIAESARASEASSARAQARQAAQHMQERLDLVNQHCQRLQDALLVSPCPFSAGT